MKKVINQGYTLTVTSWENDGDNRQTNSVTIDNKEKAQALYHLLQLCTSRNNNPPGVIRLGNTGEEGFSSEQINLLANFFQENPILLQEPLTEIQTMDEEERKDYIANLFYETENGLLGSSEWFTCRVMESCSVTYSPEDVYLEEINFE